MDKRKIILVSVIVLFLLELLPSPQVKAIFSSTQTFIAKPQDGYLAKQASTYWDAWTASNATATVTSTASIIGGESATPTLYTIYRGFLYFDTSSLTLGITIKNATLSIFVQAVSSPVFNVTIQSGMPTYPHDPLVSTDYLKTYYTGNLGSRNASTMVPWNYWNVTLSSTGVDSIAKLGMTKLAIRSSKDIDGVAPSVGQTLTVQFASFEYGESYAAKLYVSYETTNVYIVHGIYYDDGTLAPVKLSMRIVYPPENDYTFILDATSGQTTVNFTLSVRPTYITWNASTALNYTRIYFFLDSDFEELWIFIPQVAVKPAYAYQFSVTDFFGMTNPFLETTRVINGSTRIVERKSLSTVGILSFIMEQWQRYGLRFRCDQGLYSLNFIAETTLSTNLQVLADAFPTSPYGNELYAYATRLNTTTIQILYSDPNLETQWVYFQITHKSGSSTIIDFTLNQSIINSLNYYWISASSSVDYKTTIKAYTTSEYDWAFTNSAPITATNPWTGLFESFGTWPTGFSPELIPAAIIILAVLGIFSYASVGVGCILAWLVTGLMMLIGWFTVALPTFGFAGFVSFLVVFVESKKTEREL